MKSRYIPFTQQPYLCVPACLQMIMYKNYIPLIPQEDLANTLGLVVPRNDVHIFSRAKTSDTLPESGWGTQIQIEEYNPNQVFPALSIPLKMKRYGLGELKRESDLTKLLNDIHARDEDALLCFDYGKLWDIKDSHGGHVCVFDFIEDGYIHMVDPESDVPKHRKVEPNKLLDSMNHHGDNNAAGVWVFQKL